MGQTGVHLILSHSTMGWDGQRDTYIHTYIHNYIMHVLNGAGMSHSFP